MSILPELILCPSARGYSINHSSGVIETLLDGGLPRSRMGVLGDSNIVSIQWSCTKEEHRYLQSFYRLILERGAFPFILKAIVDKAEVENFEGKIKSGTFKTSIKNKRYITSCVMWLKDIKRDDDSDLTNIALISATRSLDETGHLEFINMFNRLVNGVPHGSDSVTETLPENID